MQAHAKRWLKTETHLNSDIIVLVVGVLKSLETSEGGDSPKAILSDFQRFRMSVAMGRSIAFSDAELLAPSLLPVMIDVVVRLGVVMR